MTRYAVISKGLSVSQMIEEVKRLGGRNVKVLSIVKQVYCDLDDAGLARLQSIPGLAVKKVKGVKHQEVRAPAMVYPAGEVIPATYAASRLGLLSGFYAFRESFDPPILGTNCTIAILDSGIRKTHEGLRGKVIYEANFSGSPTLGDIFDHGTGVAYVAAGGRHAEGEESGIAVGAYLWNIKVLDDNGEGTEETVVAGLEECYRLEKLADEQGLPVTDPMDLNIVNMSFGTPDDGDPDNPIRAAIRTAMVDPAEPMYYLPIAAAGNAGPEPGTIMCPACDPLVIAVGSMTFSPFAVWELSSRGPTKEGLTKPDFAGYGVRMLTASSKADDAYVVKSGTSFSAPAATGGMGLVWEIMRRTYGEAYYPTIEEIQEMGPSICVKPEGAPLEKDNDIGYGLFHGLAVYEMGRARMMPLAGITEMVVPILGLGMVGMMMSGMMKGVSK